MGKFDLLFFAVSTIALISGSGVFSPRSRPRRDRMAGAGVGVGVGVGVGAGAGVGAGRYADPIGSTQVALTAPQNTAVNGAAGLCVACVEILDESGDLLFEGSLPASAQLPRVEAQSCGSSDFHILLSVAYDDLSSGQQHIVLRSVPNGWYLRGEFIFGVRAGWLVFDPRRDRLYHLEQAQLDRAGIADPASCDGPSNASFVLLDDVPETLRAVMTRLDSE